MALDKAPYSSAGHLMSWVPRVPRGDDIEWRDNTPFEATMELITYGRGMSSARFTWQDHENHQYEMFLKDMMELILKTVIDHGVVTGKWRVCKRGQNYGIQFVE